MTRIELGRLALVGLVAVLACVVALAPLAGCTSLGLALECTPQASLLDTPECRDWRLAKESKGRRS